MLSRSTKSRCSPSIAESLEPVFPVVVADSLGALPSVALSDVVAVTDRGELEALNRSSFGVEKRL